MCQKRGDSLSHRENIDFLETPTISGAGRQTSNSTLHRGDGESWCRGLHKHVGRGEERRTSGVAPTTKSVVAISRRTYKLNIDANTQSPTAILLIIYAAVVDFPLRLIRRPQRSFQVCCRTWWNLIVSSLSEFAVMRPKRSLLNDASVHNPLSKSIPMNLVLLIFRNSKF